MPLASLTQNIYWYKMTTYMMNHKCVIISYIWELAIVSGKLKYPGNGGVGINKVVLYPNARLFSVLSCYWEVYIQTTKVGI